MLTLGTSASEAQLEGEPLVPPKVREWCTEFLRCRSCGRIFWPGTHYPKFQDWISRILGEEG